MRQSLQNETENNYQKFITNCDRSLLQSTSGITKCDSYYKVRRNRGFLKVDSKYFFPQVTLRLTVFWKNANETF